MYDILRALLDGDEFPIVERFEISGRDESYASIPKFLFDSRIGLHLYSQFGRTENPLWAHQAQALDSLGHGNNVVVSTGTASGKSLIFRSLAFHVTLLDPKSRVLVFYPLKALAADQIRGWREMARLLKLDETYVGRIDGSVPVREREDVLRKARIVVMTPDVCHAWLMFRLSLSVIKSFVKALSILVMDEAHTLEGVFGSNFAFFLRRLIAARNLLQDEVDIPSLQLVAATATIKNPGEHMKQLTSAEFDVVDHEADGAPQYERLVAHIACSPREEVSVIKALHNRLLSSRCKGGFITFLDSRKGVEGLAIENRAKPKQDELNELLNTADVLPYRGGYIAEDRQKIEERLQSGSLRGIISTSALELGIDIPHLQVGFNIGVPGTRKGYRQRLGRIGRNGPGAFVVIASPNAFLGYGTSFQEYHDMSVETSYLYLDNRFMQFAHARCLAVELESLGAPSSTPTRVAWPRRFGDIHVAARPGGNRPPEFDAVAALGGDTPHYNYPLRNVGEVSYQIKMNVNSDSLGEVSQLQALRECYPGATYLHLMRSYEVTAWHTSTFESFIRVKNAPPGRLTQPRITTWINAEINSMNLLDNHFVRNKNGFLAECLMQITERVEGYIDTRTDEFYSYQDLQKRNPEMRARSRNFRTSGVVLYIGQDWFEGSAKREFAARLREIFAREYSISIQNIGSAGTNISVHNMDGRGLRGKCIAVYDEIYGSLRLTERLYLEFERVLDRLSTALTADSGDNDALKTFATRIQKEFSTFTEGIVAGVDATDVPTGYKRIFKCGSRVCYQQAGQMAIDVEIVQPTMMTGTLMYQVRVPTRPGQSPMLRWISASSVEPSATADAWDYAWWNRETETYEEPPDGEE